MPPNSARGFRSFPAEPYLSKADTNPDCCITSTGFVSMAFSHLVRRRAVVVPLRRSNAHYEYTSIRLFVTAHLKASDPPDAEAATASLNSRWLSDLKRRIGKCVTFGIEPAQVEEAGLILKEIARDWRELVAGSEGFLTGRTRRGLHRHKVVWGEMVRKWSFGLSAVS